MKRTDNRKLLVKFVIDAPLVGSFVADYGDQVEGLIISPIVPLPYNKNKPAIKPKNKKPKKGKGKTSAFIIKSMSRHKSQSRKALVNTMIKKGFDGRGVTGVINALVRLGHIKRSGDTLTYTNGADNG